jgi:uncharacterized protein (UPF0371 family)
MGVNRAGFGITDDAATREAATQEVIRRYFRYSCEYAMGLTDHETVERCELLMKELNVHPEDRRVVLPARKAAEDAVQSGKGNEGIFCGAAIELRNGNIMTGKNSPLMHAASSLVLNAIKTLAEIPDKIHLLSPTITAAIGTMKRDILNRKAESLSLDETLIALCISSTTNPTAQAAMDQLKDLAGCEMHMTHIPTPGDEAGLRRLGVNLTTDPNFPSKNLFVG